eukprot:403374403
MLLGMGNPQNYQQKSQRVIVSTSIQTQGAYTSNQLKYLRYTAFGALSLSALFVIYLHYELLAFQYHFYAFFLNLTTFGMLSYASLKNSVSASYDTSCKLAYSIALTVSYVGIPFYWGIIYNEEFNSGEWKNYVTPFCCGFLSLIFITFEFLINAVQFTTSNWYYSAGLCFLYLALDNWRTHVTGYNLVSIYTWIDGQSYFYAVLLIIMQIFMFFVMSIVSENKTLSGATRN